MQEILFPLSESKNCHTFLVLHCPQATQLYLEHTKERSIIFCVEKTLKDITNHSLKLAKVFSNSLSHLKPIPYFILMIPNILEPTRLVRNLPPHKQIKKHLIILQTKQFITFIICLNSKVFIETAVRFRNV